MRFLAYFALAAALAVGCVHPHAGAGEGSAEYERDEERHPIDHFTTKAVFRATFFTPASPDAIAWPKPGSAVELVEVSCAVLDGKSGRTATCVPGYSLDKKFTTLLHDDDPPLGKAMKDRLAECYDVRTKAWAGPALRAYEAALRASPLAIPTATDDAWVIAYVAHDAAPFVGKCKPEPDGTCLYAAGSQPEATVEARVARGGKAVSAIPFTPETRRLSMTFFDGHEPVQITRVPFAKETNGSDRDVELDPTKVAWDPIIAWYGANDPRSANLAVALVLAGRIADAHGVGAPVDGLDRDDYLAKDPCMRGAH